MVKTVLPVLRIEVSSLVDEGTKILRAMGCGQFIYVCVCIYINSIFLKIIFYLGPPDSFFSFHGL